MTTDAPPTAPTEEEAIIQAMAAEGMPGLEPGSIAAGQVLHRGDDELPAPVVVGGVRSAGYTTIYNVRTGESSSCNRNMLLSLLKERFTDGARECVFSVYDPRIAQFKGSVKCFLHADDPRRAEFDELGLPTCPSNGLANVHQRELHMRHTHKTSWQTIERLRTQAERDEDRAFQRALLSTVGGQPAAMVEVPVAEELVAEELTVDDSHVDVTPPDDGRPQYACRVGECPWEPKEDSPRPGPALKQHQSIMHPEA